ncbi:MAG: hypothetical protein M3M96_01115 [Candidatus Eremiobacteraeota bacterium]|nr:hypothetical protein [Candidatus Eremiobacteraeota bacterium]
MSDFSALAYLEVRQGWNRARQTLRQPARLIMYALAIAYFVFLGGIRFWTSGHHHRPMPGVPEPYASAIFFAALLAFALALLSAAAGHVGAFTSLADARFLIGSQLRERNVIVWLQLRASWRMIARLLFLIIFYTILYSSSGSFLGMALSMMGFIAFAASCAIPTMRLQRRFGARIGYALPIAVGSLGLAGLAALGVGLLWPPHSQVATAVIHIGFGRLVHAMLAGAWLPITGLFLLTLIMGATAYWGAEDLYPELYRGSSRMIDLARLRRRNPFGFRREDASKTVISESVDGSGGMRGAWSLLWKDWVQFKRLRGGRTSFVAGAFVSMLAGAVCGIIAHRSHDALAISVGLGASVGNVLVILVSMYSSTSLAADIGKPLWWLNVQPLRTRLYVQAAATSWRLALCISFGLIAWAFIISSPLFALAAIPAAVCTVAFLRAIGLALYSLFPSALDQRGPVAMLRVLALYVLLAPPLAAGALTGIFLHTAVLGIGVGLAFALVQALLLVEFAAYRIARSGIAFAQAEAS